MSYKERLIRLYLLPLVYDSELKDITFFHKCLHGKIDLNVHGFVSFVTHARTRLSNSFNLKSPVCKTSAFQASYFSRIVNLWNFICKSVLESSLSSIDVFENSLKQSLTCLLHTTFDVESLCTWSLVRSCACHRLQFTR